MLKKLRRRISLKKLGRLGQSTTEYILILAVAVAIATKFRETIVGRVSDITLRIGEQIDAAVNPNN